MEFPLVVRVDPSRRPDIRTLDVLEKMGNRTRLHVPGAVHCVTLRSRDGVPLFDSIDEIDAFETILVGSLRRYGYLLHAYCWMRDGAIMAIQTSQEPLGRGLQRITSRYTLHSNALRGRQGPLFEERYRSLLVQKGRYLTALIRYIHRAPVRSRLVARVNDHAWSSHHAYAGNHRISWLTTHQVKRRLAFAGIRTESAYRVWVELPEDDRFLQLMREGHAADSRVVGNDAYVRALGLAPAVAHDSRSIDQITLDVARTLGVTLSHLHSSTRERRYVLARALIAWEATQRGGYTLKEVAAYLGRDPSTLLSAMARYRETHADLFDGPFKD